MPIKLQPIDNPINNQLLKEANELFSFPVKKIYTRYNKLPNIINDTPDFSSFIIVMSF